MNDQAKLLLCAYRPSGADASDPAFADALAQAERDPHLRAWLAESQTFDQAISTKLRSVQVPQNLRATILAGARLSRPRRWWQRPRLWAIAALLTVLASLFVFWQSHDAPLAQWQADSLAVLDKIEAGTVPFDTENPHPTDLVAWLRQNAAPIPSAIPSALATHTTYGCKTIDTSGRKVSLICFDLGSGDEAHLFTTASAGLPFEPLVARPAFARSHPWNVATWRSGEVVHMIASKMPPDQLRTLLPPSVIARHPLPSLPIAGLLARH